MSVTSQGTQQTGSRRQLCLKSQLRPHLLPLINTAASAPAQHGAEAPLPSGADHLPTRGNSSRRLLWSSAGGGSGDARDHRTRLCQGARPGHGVAQPSRRLPWGQGVRQNGPRRGDRGRRTLPHLYPRLEVRGGMRYTLTSGFTQRTDSYSSSAAAMSAPKPGEERAAGAYWPAALPTAIFDEGRHRLGAPARPGQARATSQKRMEPSWMLAAGSGGGRAPSWSRPWHSRGGQRHLGAWQVPRRGWRGHLCSERHPRAGQREVAGGMAGGARLVVPPHGIPLLVWIPPSGLKCSFSGAGISRLKRKCGTEHNRFCCWKWWKYQLCKA